MVGDDHEPNSRGLYIHNIYVKKKYIYIYKKKNCHFWPWHKWGGQHNRIERTPNKSLEKKHVCLSFFVIGLFSHDMFQTTKVVTNGKRNLQPNILVGYTSHHFPPKIQGLLLCYAFLGSGIPSYKLAFVTVAGGGYISNILDPSSLPTTETKAFNSAFLPTRKYMAMSHTMTHWQCSTIQGSLQLRRPFKATLEWICSTSRFALTLISRLVLKSWGFPRQRTSRTWSSQLAVNQNFFASLQS